MVMRDDQTEPERRDRMAVAAAPFVHVRAADEKPGKRERALPLQRMPPGGSMLRRRHQGFS
jgi:hypothetical protein